MALLTSWKFLTLKRSQHEPCLQAKMQGTIPGGHAPFIQPKSLPFANLRIGIGRDRLRMRYRY